MKKYVKIISLILALILAVSALTACSGQNKDSGGSSNSGVPVGGDGKFTVPQRMISDETLYTDPNGIFDYMFYDNGGAVIIEHKGEEENIVIPDTLGGQPVVAIGAGAFYGNEKATSVTISKNVEIIGASAFNGCYLLSSVSIPSSVWAIYPDAFTDTPWLTAVCAQEEFVIVGDSVLLKYNGSSSRVVIPNTVKHISAAFMGNENIKDVTVPDSVYTVGCAAFSSSTVLKVELGNNVVLIDDSAFSYCYDLHYINMPESLKTIETYAFTSCTGLNYVKIGKNVETIGEYAFYRASQFSYLYLPKSVKTIGNHAFTDCNYLSYVYYEGSKEKFDALGVSGYNSKLADAKKFYNYDYIGGTYEAQ